MSAIEVAHTDSIERILATGRPLGLRLLAAAAVATADDVVNVGRHVTADDVRAVDAALGELWSVALTIAAKGVSPAPAELQAELVAGGRYAGDHGAVLQDAMLRLATTVGHPQLLRAAAADVLGVAYRARLWAAGGALADAACRLTEADSFTLLVREGARLRITHEHLHELRGAA